jgi:hypothetical protein
MLSNSSPMCAPRSSSRALADRQIRGVTPFGGGKGEGEGEGELQFLGKLNG